MKRRPVPATRKAPAVSANGLVTVAPSAGPPTSARGTCMTNVPFGPGLKAPVIVWRPLYASALTSNVPSLNCATALRPVPEVVACANHHVLPPGALAVPDCCQYTVQSPERTFGLSAVGGASRSWTVIVTSMFALPGVDANDEFSMSRLSMFCPEPPG